jgi:hypothetical protein
MDIYSKRENKTTAYKCRLGEIPNSHRFTNKNDHTVVFITKKDLERINRSSTPQTPAP